jgi:hypothetical protein
LSPLSYDTPIELNQPTLYNWTPTHFKDGFDFDFLCITSHNLIAIGSTILSIFYPITYGLTFHEKIDHLDGINKGANVISFDILDHGFCEIDERE